MLKGIRKLFGGSGAPTEPLQPRQLYFDTLARVLYIGTDGTLLGNSVIGVAGFVGITVVKQNAVGFRTYPTLQEAEDAAEYGDTIIVNSGTYSLGSSSLVLRDGINKQFMPNVTILSDNISGTIIDNGAYVNQQWYGSPFISNSNGLDHTIRINFTNAQSLIRGFYWQYDAYYENSVPAVLTYLSTVETNIIDIPYIDFINTSIGQYESVYSLFNPNKTYLQFILHDTNKIGNEYIEGYIGSVGGEYGKIRLNVYDTGVPSNSTGQIFRIKIITKP